MAEVFRAESIGLQGFRKQVAIKRVLAHLASKESFIKMFLDEARLSARLSHSNCVQVFDIGVGDGTYFIVMEFVDGANLRGIIETLKNANRPFPVEESIYIAIELCKGLQYAHGLYDENGNPLNIVHRDMSPPNVLVTKHGEVKIVDFGLAKANTQLERSEPGIIKGKFSYLAPEAAKGQEVDARADVFAIGIMLWELLAARRLFLGKTDLETVQLVQRALIPPITRIRNDVPPELEPIIAKALAADPNQRYQTARDLGADLNAFLYRFGQHPVTDFEIADLVYSAMEQRRREKEAQRASGVDQFLQWAEAAVFQIESIDAKNAQGATALDVEAFAGTGLRRQANLPQAGNLSDLEETDDVALRRNMLPTPSPMMAPVFPVSPPKSSSFGGSGEPEIERYGAPPPPGRAAPISLAQSSQQTGAGNAGTPSPPTMGAPPSAQLSAATPTPHNLLVPIIVAVATTIIVMMLVFQMVRH